MDIQLHEISCVVCGVSFWITKSYQKELRRCHNTFYCPNGHSQNYPAKTEGEKAIEERDRYKRWYNDQKETSQSLARSNSALRGVIERNKQVPKGGE